MFSTTAFAYVDESAVETETTVEETEAETEEVEEPMGPLTPDGNETVHFLNLVNEADLLALTDEE